MRRRELFALVGGVVAWPRAARGRKRRRHRLPQRLVVGLLGHGPVPPGIWAVSLCGLQRAVNGPFEFAIGADCRPVGERQDLCKENAGDALRRVEPVISVEDAGPGQTAGAAAELSPKVLRRIRARSRRAPHRGRVPRAGCRRADLDAPPRRKNHRCSLSQRHGKVVRLVSGSNQSRQQGVARQVPGLGAVIRAAGARWQWLWLGGAAGTERPAGALTFN
jgi:hypothetical protein